jgi:hypothetical protein
MNYEKDTWDEGWNDGWEAGYRRGYGHGLKDMLSLALDIVEKAKTQAVSFGITDWPFDDIRTKLAEKYNELTKDTE